ERRAEVAFSVASACANLAPVVAAARRLCAGDFLDDVDAGQFADERASSRGSGSDNSAKEAFVGKLAIASNAVGRAGSGKGIRDLARCAGRGSRSYVARRELGALARSQRGRTKDERAGRGLVVVNDHVIQGHVTC